MLHSLTPLTLGVEMAKAIDTVQFQKAVAAKVADRLVAADVSSFSLGDRVRVQHRGERFVGIVTAHSGRGVLENFTVRSKSGQGFVDRTVPLAAHGVLAVEVIEKGSRHLRAGRKTKIQFTKEAYSLAAIKAFKKRARLHAYYRAGSKAQEAKHNAEVLRGIVETAVSEAVAEDKATIIGGLDPSAVPLTERISDLAKNLRDASSNERIERLVEALLPSTDPLVDVRAQLEVDNAELRARFLQEVPSLTAAQVADLAGHRATNKSATATRWKTAGKVFSVVQGGRELFPTFQFADGQPRPVIHELLQILHNQLSAWELAFWFVSSNAWLDGSAPIGRLDDAGDVVLEAARRSVDGLST